MKSTRWMPAVLPLVVMTVIAVSGCSSTFVVVPRPASQYTATDTLYATHNGDDVRVTFHFDTVMRVDTVVRVDTAWRRGSRTILHVDTVVRTDTVVRADTVRTFATDTVVRTRTILRTDTVRVTRPRSVRVDTVMRVDTVRVRVTDTVTRVDTVRVRVTDTVARVDTVRVPVTQTVTRVDTVRVPVTQTVTRVDTVLRVDTVRVRVADTVARVDTVMRVDTLRVAVTDTVIRTVRIPGRRMLFVPPGHYPPEGRCRVWIHDLPPGQQAKAAACDALREIPDGAFILFGGDAWDFDYDWLAEAEANPGTVPTVILGLSKRRK